MRTILVALILACLAGCVVRPHDVGVAVEICERHGGWEWLKYDGHIKCVDGFTVEAILYGAPNTKEEE
jgi:hypothetical protein